MAKTYTVIRKNMRTDRESEMTGTIPELVEDFSYTLECGESYQHERGNKKINTNPKTFKSLLNNINNAVSNSASNGCANSYYYAKSTTLGL